MVFMVRTVRNALGPHRRQNSEFLLMRSPVVCIVTDLLYGFEAAGTVTACDKFCRANRPPPHPPPKKKFNLMNFVAWQKPAVGCLIASSSSWSITVRAHPISGR
jgi:hypothetical protein